MVELPEDFAGIQSINASFLDDVFNLVYNVSNVTSNEDRPIDSTVLLHYKYGIPFMMMLCVISTIINLKILGAAFWIRRPMSPTLKISLSLAGADAYSSCSLGIGLFVNSWMPAMGYITHVSHCPLLVFEALRLGGVFMTVLHLLFLAVNHYLGIVRPLHYQSIMTRRFTSLFLCVLWIAPITFFFVYFSLQENDGFQTSRCDFEFLRRQQFRAVFACGFFGAFTLMLLIYGYIVPIVKEHQAKRVMYIMRGSPSNNRSGIEIDLETVRMRAQDQQLDKNLKALWTTMMILGSYIVGWLPGVIHFLMVCDDCYVSLNYLHPVTTFYICLVTNTFIIMKTVMNPIIYAARMNEIKIATMKMNAAIMNSLNKRRNRQGTNPWGHTSQSDPRISSRKRGKKLAHNGDPRCHKSREVQEDERLKQEYFACIQMIPFQAENQKSQVTSTVLVA